MAKDRRDKTRTGQVDLSKRVAAQYPASRTSSGRSPSGNTPGRKTPPKKKKQSTAKVVLLTLLVVLILAVLFFLVQIGQILYNTFFGDDEQVGDDIRTESYDTTPASYQDEVSYYLVGVLGEEQDSTMEMLTLICHDKNAETLNFLEVPVDTYLGESDTWAVKRIGDVWSNPRPLQWCDVCRREVSEDEIADGRHNIESCGATITQKSGSAYRDLIRVFNEQYSLPVDHYFILSQESLSQLVDLVGGVDVELNSYMSVGDQEYSAGVRTLDGAAVLAYITDRSSGVSGDLERIISCRQVYAALLQRLISLDSAELLNTDPSSPEEGVIGEVMNGASPIRTDTDGEGITEILLSLKDIPLSSMTMYRMPGEAATLSGATMFSVHKDDLLTLLRESFDPYGEEIYGKPIEEGDLNITEIANDETSNTRKQTVAEVIEEQKGTVTTTTTSSSATDATAAA